MLKLPSQISARPTAPLNAPGLPVLALLLILTACSTTPTIGTSGEEINRVVCESFKPISYSASRDSERTIAEIREFNAALETFCGDDE